METSMINIPIYVDQEKLLEKPVTKNDVRMISWTRFGRI